MSRPFKFLIRSTAFIGKELTEIFRQPRLIMNNPFEYIKIEREAKAQKKAQQEKEAAAKAEAKRKERERVLVELINPYDKMVTSLLESLREIDYHIAQVAKPHTYISLDEVSANPKWSIEEHWTTQSSDYGVDTSTSGITTFVEVILNINSNNQPIEFVCRRINHKGNAEVRCRLSENDLLNALKKLHPAG